MAIDPLQSFAPRPLFSQRGAVKTELTAASPFEALLASVNNGAADAKTAQQAAAELLRMEMMQSSLSLAGLGEDSAAPSGLKAMETLLCGVAGARRNYVEKGGQSGAADAAISGLTGAVSSNAGANLATVSDTAARFIGTPYRFGGEGPKGIDCSSFVQQVFREHQVTLPRTAREQSQVGTDVAAGDLKKGDLVFFHTYASYPSHVGIYLGDGKMIHASSAKGEVTVSNINSDYYRSRFLGAKRIA